MANIKIFSWNVNSVNARLENLIRFTKEYKPDILLLQELKAEEHKVPISVLEHLGYNVAVSGQKSYNGVAILSRFRMEDVLIRDFNGNEGAARYIEALVTNGAKCMRVASVYVPNGQTVKSPQLLRVTVMELVKKT
jgi:exodeoxyribonuclease-3